MKLESRDQTLSTGKSRHVCGLPAAWAANAARLVMRTFVCLVLIVSTVLGGAGKGKHKEHLAWSRMPQFPPPEGRDKQIGLAGMFAGIHDDVLIMAGGANFADGAYWEDGKKIWYDDIYVLVKVKEGEAGGEAETTFEGKDLEGAQRYKWARTDVKLPIAFGYGASISTPDGIVCIGGHDEADGRGAHHADVFRLKWNDKIKTVEIDRRLPPLPKASKMRCAGMIDQVIYVAGYTESDEGEPQKHFWALDLSGEPTQGAGGGKPEWVELLPWEGPALQGATCGVQDGKLYLFGGTRPVLDKDGKPTTVPSLATYQFKPGKRDVRGGFQDGEWKRVADLPRPVLAAPSPAQPTGQSHLLVFSGSDGSEWHGDLSEHPGFATEVLAYHTITDTWRKLASMPCGVVTAPTVKWGDTILIVSGELRPCVRNPDILVARLRETPARFGVLNWSVLIAYLAILVLMGFYFSAREKSTEDFFLAGRRIPAWAAGISIFATLLSAITFMAAPAKAYSTDWAFFFPGIIGLATLPVIILLVIPFFRRLNLTTAYEYLERRFNLPVRWVGSSLFIMSQVGRMGVVLFLPALALTTVTGMNVYLCIVLMGVLCTLYTAMGGVEAVIWSDVLQGVVLMGAALLSLIVIVASIDGGFATVFSTAYGDGKLRMVHLTWDYTTPALWIIVVSHLLGVFNSATDQSTVQRWLTTKGETQTRGAVYVNTAVGISAGFLFFSVGTALYVFFKTNPCLLEPTMKNDAVFPLFIMRQLPMGVSGLVIAGIFSASMSSLDSAINSVSMAITNDFYKRLKPGVSEHKSLTLARWLTVVLGVFGTLAAATLVYFGDAVKSIWDVYISIMGLLLGGLAGLFAVGILTRRATGAGAFVGIVTSAVAVFCVQRYTALHFFLYGTVGIITCFVVTYVTSAIIPARRKSIDGLTVYTMPQRVD